MAGRPRRIDRDKVLDAAEALVLRAGAAALSFDAVAREAGITKGGVQYAFGTRDKLIRAMLTRWGAAFDADVAERCGPDPSRARGCTPISRPLAMPMRPSSPARQ